LIGLISNKAEYRKVIATLGLLNLERKKKKIKDEPHFKFCSKSNRSAINNKNYGMLIDHNK
jgi:hypothetical protein